MLCHILRFLIAFDLGISVLLCLMSKKFITIGMSLVVQWLRLHTPNAGGMGSITGWGTKVLHAPWLGQKKKKKKNRNHYIYLKNFTFYPYSFNQGLFIVLPLCTKHSSRFLGIQQ